MSINYVKGDATCPVSPGTNIISHVCNDIGAWGRGFVMVLTRMSPKPETEYREWYRNRENNDFGLGSVQFVVVEPNLLVANMIGQQGIRRTGFRQMPPVRYDAIRMALGSLAEKAVELKASVHMPRIGCGLAGGKWEDIEPIIQDELISNKVPVTVYDLP